MNAQADVPIVTDLVCLVLATVLGLGKKDPVKLHVYRSVKGFQRRIKLPTHLGESENAYSKPVWDAEYRKRSVMVPSRPV